MRSRKNVKRTSAKMRMKRSVGKKARSREQQAVVDLVDPHLLPELADIVGDYYAKPAEEKGFIVEDFSGVRYPAIWKGQVDGQGRKQGEWEGVVIGKGKQGGKNYNDPISWDLELTPSVETVTEYYVNGKLHSIDDQPARVLTATGGVGHVWEWYRRGKKHRDNGPAVLQDNIHGHVRVEEYFKDGKLHRIGKPAKIQRDDDGFTSAGWYRNGKPYSENGLVEIEKDPDGFITEIWITPQGFKTVTKDPAGNVVADYGSEED